MNKADEKIEVTKGELEDMVARAVGTALESNKPQQRRLRNEDLAINAAGANIQTQEDVAMIAASVGPSSHGRGFVPVPPEFCAAMDFAEHRPTINEVEALGYVVELDKVEFKARWEPTERQQTENGVADVIIKKAEPKEAQPLLERLNDLDPRNSRVWIQAKQRGLTIGSERQLTEAVEKDSQNELVTAAAADTSYREKVISGLEGGALNLDGDGFEIGSAAGAPEGAVR